MLNICLVEDHLRSSQNIFCLFSGSLKQGPCKIARSILCGSFVPKGPCATRSVTCDSIPFLISTKRSRDQQSILLSNVGTHLNWGQPSTLKCIRYASILNLQKLIGHYSLQLNDRGGTHAASQAHGGHTQPQKNGKLPIWRFQKR